MFFVHRLKDGAGYDLMLLQGGIIYLPQPNVCSILDVKGGGTPVNEKIGFTISA